MSVRIVYQDIAAGAKEDAQASAQGGAAFCTPALLPQGSDRAPIATLGPGSWLLDGSREILDRQIVPFWSAPMSGADARFPTPPVITITFSQRYTSPGLTLCFDPASGEFCSSVTIRWYQGASKLYESDYFPDGVEFFCSHTVRAYDKIEIQLNSTSVPWRFAKLSRILFGVERVFLREELRNVKAVQQVSLISSEIAVNTLAFTLDSRSGVEYLFQKKQPVSAFDGETLIGVFYISTAKRRGAGLYDISCVDAVGVLDEDPYGAKMLVDHSAQALLEDILGGHFELDLDPALSAATLTGYLPEGTRRQALQQAAFALGAMADTSGSRAIRVYLDREAGARKLPKSRIYTGGTVERSAIVTAVRLLSHTYSTAGAGNDQVAVDGVAYCHTAQAVAIQNPDVTASDKQNVVEVKDATLVTSRNAPAVTQRIYNYCAMRDRQSIRIVVQGEKPGDHVAAPTPWGTVVDGYITSLRLTLSGVTAAECEIVGVEVQAVGESEPRMSGEFMSGAI